jgi:hypothetical protein
MIESMIHFGLMSGSMIPFGLMNGSMIPIGSVKWIEPIDPKKNPFRSDQMPTLHKMKKKTKFFSFFDF